MRSVTAATVAKSFSGDGKYGLASIEQATETAMRLPMAVIACTKQFGQLADPGACLQSEALKKYGVTATEKLATVGDFQ